MPNLDLYSDTFYTTTDTATAAYLYMQGFHLINVQVKPKSSIFVFQNTNDILEKVRLFETAQATGSLLVYIQCYRKCLGMAVGRRQ